MPIIQVVAGVIYNAKGEILIAKRPLHKVEGGLWEFPGGKIEPHETPQQALQRELWEEIGIQLHRLQPLTTVLHRYPNYHVELDVWQIKHFSHTPYGKEGQAIRWIKPHSLQSLPFPAANQSVLEKVMRMGCDIVIAVEI